MSKALSRHGISLNTNLSTQAIPRKHAELQAASTLGKTIQVLWAIEMAHYAASTLQYKRHSFGRLQELIVVQ